MPWADLAAAGVRDPLPWPRDFCSVRHPTPWLPPQPSPCRRGRELAVPCEGQGQPLRAGSDSAQTRKGPACTARGPRPTDQAGCPASPAERALPRLEPRRGGLSSRTRTRPPALSMLQLSSLTLLFIPDLKIESPHQVLPMLIGQQKIFKNYCIFQRNQALLSEPKKKKKILFWFSEGKQ